MNTLATIEKLQSSLRHISFNREAIQGFAQSIQPDDVQKTKEKLTRYYWTFEEEVLIIMYFNAMNFCYWSEKGNEKWSVNINGEKVDGSMGLFKLLEETLKQTPSLLDPHEMVRVSKKDFDNLVKGSVEIPLQDERFSHLIDTAQTLVDRFHADIRNLFKEVHDDAVKLCALIETSFASYADTQRYMDTDIHFLKRAQLSVKMISDARERCEMDALKNVDELTALADYKVPQLMRHLGIIQYSDELAQLVDTQTLIEKDSLYEVEIRIATIWAVELIRRSLDKAFSYVTASDIDSLIWLAGQKNIDGMKPYHRTYTTAY